MGDGTQRGAAGVIRTGTLATAALLPFPTAVVAEAIENGNRADARVAVALYALVSALLSANWWVFFH